MTFPLATIPRPGGRLWLENPDEPRLTEHEKLATCLCEDALSERFIMPPPGSFILTGEWTLFYLVGVSA